MLPDEQLVLYPANNTEDSIDSTRVVEGNEDSRLKPVKTLRIAVTGDVHITRIEKLIIDTRGFQRLRRVRQLGTVNMVYPTALHSRFDHCLGTMAMAWRMIKAIEDNAHSSVEEKTISDDQKILVRLYALLHDIPHIPFGHTLEDELEIFTRHDKNFERLDHFLGKNSEIGKIIISRLGEEIYDRFWSIYNWNGDEEPKTKLDLSAAKNEVGTIPTELINDDDAFVYDLVSNTVCADLLDYLARDSYFCNLGSPMEYRFLHFLYLAKIPSNRDPKKNYKRVVIRLWKGDHPQPRRDTLTDLARLMEARYMIAERAYFHHAKIISGAMLGRALYDEFRPVGATLTRSEAELYEHSDDSLVFSLSQSASTVSSKLANALLDRRLYKNRNAEFELKYSRSDFDSVQAHDHRENTVDTLFKKLTDPMERRSLENDFADQIGAEDGDVIIYAPEEKMNMKVAKMKVLWKGNMIPFERIDDPIITPRLAQILEAHKLLWSVNVLFNPELDEEQISLLKDICDVEFLSSPNSRTYKTKNHRLLQRQVERYLKKNNFQIPTTAKEYSRLKSTVATELALAARNKRNDTSFQNLLKKECGKVFGKKKAPQGSVDAN